MRYNLTPRADHIRALRAQIRRLEDEITVLIQADTKPDPIEPSTPECGSEPGYKRHRAAADPACDPCKAAHTAYVRERYAARRKLKKAS